MHTVKPSRQFWISTAVIITLVTAAVSAYQLSNHKSGINAEKGTSVSTNKNDSDTMSVPLVPVAHLSAVDITIKGKPYKFVVDTGAAGAMRITPEAASALELQEVGVMRDGDPSGRDARELPVVRVGNVILSSSEFTGIDAVVGGRLPGIEADGVIGLDFFKGWVVTLNYPAQKLELSRSPMPTTGEHTVAYTTPHGVPSVEIRIDGQVLKADIDTGGPGFLTVPQSLGLSYADQPRLAGKGRSVNGEFDIYKAVLTGSLTVAGWNCESVEVDIADRFPVASLGSQFFKQYKVSFDTAHKRVSIEP